MKKILTVVVLAIAAISASAEVEESFRCGIQANIGISDVVGQGDHASFSYGAGLVVEYNFKPSFYLQSGLGFQDITHTEDAIDGTLHGYFLQLPVHIGGRFSLGDNSDFFMQAGPTFGVGVGGSKIELTYGNYSTTYNYFDLLKRFDLGLGARLGFEFSGFQISLGVNGGVLQAAESNGYHNLTANLGLAYMF